MRSKFHSRFVQGLAWKANLRDTGYLDLTEHIATTRKDARP